MTSTLAVAHAPTSETVEPKRIRSRHAHLSVENGHYTSRGKIMVRPYTWPGNDRSQTKMGLWIGELDSFALISCKLSTVENQPLPARIRIVEDQQKNGHDFVDTGLELDLPWSSELEFGVAPLPAGDYRYTFNVQTADGNGAPFILRGCTVTRDKPKDVPTFSGNRNGSAGAALPSTSMDPHVALDPASAKVIRDSSSGVNKVTPGNLSPRNAALSVSSMDFMYLHPSVARISGDKRVALRLVPTTAKSRIRCEVEVPYHPNETFDFTLAYGDPTVKLTRSIKMDYDAAPFYAEFVVTVTEPTTLRLSADAPEFKWYGCEYTPL